VSTKRAFTLMETLLYLGIFAIVGGLLVSVLLGTLRVQTEDQAARVVSEEGRFVTETVKRLVREASLIDMSTTTAQGTLILRLPKRNDGNTIFEQGSWRGGEAGESVTEKSTTTFTSSDNIDFSSSTGAIQLLNP